MTDLTEQWEKGELPAGEYYIRYPFGETTTSVFDGKHWEYLFDNDEVKDVLAPVPSYEEWKSAYECQLMESELVLTLKDLLKRAKDILEDEGDYMIVQQIDEVLK